MKLIRNRKREGGFTLIELVSVVIILGILAAVVVPKYFDMTSKAQDAAYKGALTEGVSRLNLAYSKYTLDKAKTPGATSSDGLGVLKDKAYLNLDNGYANIGDYYVLYTSGTDASGNDAMKVALYDKDQKALSYSDATDTKTDPVQTFWVWPQ